MLKYTLSVFIILFNLHCIAGEIKAFSTNPLCLLPVVINRDTATWTDASRKRVIPLAFYNQTDSKKKLSAGLKQKLVIINTGYQGKNTDYSYIAKNLADAGFFVVTIQHDLPSDSPISTNGDIQQTRLPFWNRGVETILFVINRLKQTYPDLDYKHLNLIGHSNGGDMVMLLATRYPEIAYKIVSLDNRRVAFPRADHPKLLSVRSGDQVADKDVIPSVEEQKRFGMKIVKVGTEHNDMGGMGSENQLQEINKYILDFLKGT